MESPRGTRRDNHDRDFSTDPPVRLAPSSHLENSPPLTNRPILSRDPIFSPRLNGATRARTHAACARARAAPRRVLARTSERASGSPMNRYGMKSKGDRDDRHRIDLISFARNYACWAHRGPASGIVEANRHTMRESSVALTKISVDHMANVTGRREGRAVLLTTWKIKANIKPWGKSD